MSQAPLTAPPSLVACDHLTERLRLDADFDVRWAAWQSRGRSAEHAFQRKLVVLVPAAAFITAIAYFLLTR